MPEQDAFEVRLHAAVRRYVGQVGSELDPVAFAMGIAAAEPRRNDLPTSLGLRGTRVSRRVLVLLMLTGLLALLLGGTLLAGSRSTWRLPAVIPLVDPTAVPAFVCPPGTDPDAAGPAPQARPPVTSRPAPMAFDRRAGRIIVLAGDGLTETWTFDVCANTWAQMHPARQPWGWPSIGQLVYDVDSDVTVAIGLDAGSGGERVWAYDLKADSWTALGLAPMSTRDRIDLAYDAASGLVIAFAPSGRGAVEPWELWTYDVDNDTWTAVRQAGGPRSGTDPLPRWLAYDAAADGLVWYRLPSPATWPYTYETWRFDLRLGVWSASGADTPPVFEGGFPPLIGGGEIAYDEAARRTVVFSPARIVAYDGAADRWDVLVEGAISDPTPGDAARPPYAPRIENTIAYDSVNRRLVAYGGRYPSAVLDADGTPTWIAATDVIAFDPSTRAWTTLLGPATTQPVP